MTQGPQVEHIVRFGIFEADLRTGELRKNGVKVKLQEQPFRILDELLARRGELVTREELRERIWGGDTFVDFEHSLNTAVAKLRTALHDSVNSPRFVETLPGRGYRFIAPMSGRDQAPGPTAARNRRFMLVLVFLVAATSILVWNISNPSKTWLRNPPTATNEKPLAALPLTAFPGFEGSPTFSPDGSQVAFTWNGEGLDNYDT